MVRAAYSSSAMLTATETRKAIVQAMFLKDLFELLEKVTDRCRDAGNTIMAIVLKST